MRQAYNRRRYEMVVSTLQEREVQENVRRTAIRYWLESDRVSRSYRKTIAICPHCNFQNEFSDDELTEVNAEVLEISGELPPRTSMP